MKEKSKTKRQGIMKVDVANQAAQMAAAITAIVAVEAAVGVAPALVAADVGVEAIEILLK